MSYAFGAKSLKEMDGIHPFLGEVLNEAIKVTLQDFSVHDGLRTLEEQRSYVRRGVSQTLNSKHRRQSDGFGHAFDAVPFINGKLRWEWPAIYPIAAAVRKAVDIVNDRRKKAGQNTHRLRWGGAWDVDFHTVDPTPDAMLKANQGYVSRRIKAGKRAFPDGPHFELA
jgi:peptidoglycan L-alanyl-D-glutamate endopeptidase CwlK